VTATLYEVPTDVAGGKDHHCAPASTVTVTATETVTIVSYLRIGSPFSKIEVHD
jgi:hypothetical protein